MPNALLYAPAGGGKTVNSTRVLAPKRGKNLLICTDNSSIVLRNFDRKNLTITEVHSVDEFLQAYHKACDSKQYDNIILDNLSDLFDMWILDPSGCGISIISVHAVKIVLQSTAVDIRVRRLSS